MNFDEKSNKSGIKRLRKGLYLSLYGKYRIQRNALNRTIKTLRSYPHLLPQMQSQIEAHLLDYAHYAHALRASGGYASVQVRCPLVQCVYYSQKTSIFQQQLKTTTSTAQLKELVLSFEKVAKSVLRNMKPCRGIEN